MVKLTRLDKFKKIVRVPQGSSKLAGSKHLSSIDNVIEDDEQQEPPDWIDIDSDAPKRHKRRVKVKKTKKKQIIQEIPENTEKTASPALSRGKRKREAKKLAWRKKFEFEKTCLDIIKENQSVDKHGHGLGSVKQLKSSLDNVEKKLTKVRKIGKRRNKVDYKARIKKKISNQWNDQSNTS